MSTVITEIGAKARSRTPRLGFLGVGWIGRQRMAAIAESGVGTVAVIADPATAMLAQCTSICRDAKRASTLDELLEHDLDGIVIASPSALHAEQTVRALERGVAVFCQKPLGRNGAETRRAIAAARAANVLLGVDLSYRHTDAMRKIRERIIRGDIGSLYAIDLTFHNAYGPDKPWFYDRALSGGGCVIDLGIHMVDLALWTVGFPHVAAVTGKLFSKGRPLLDSVHVVEDYAVATIELGPHPDTKPEPYYHSGLVDHGCIVRLACSWHLSAGCDAVIEAAFYGTRGGAAMRNVDGSFHDFRAILFRGTQSELVAAPPDAWGGRAAIQWAERLSRGERYNADIEQLIAVADTLDRIYANAGRRAPGWP